MQNFYLTKYIRESWQFPPEFFEALRYEIDGKINYFGHHFRHPKEDDKINIYKNKLFFEILKLRKLSSIILRNRNIKLGSEQILLVNNGNPINSSLNKIGYRPFLAPWEYEYSQGKGLVPSISFFKTIYRIKWDFLFSDLHKLISSDFIRHIELFINLFERYLLNNKIKGGIFLNDLSFFENISIQVLKKNNLPSFIFLHGLPGRYNDIDDNRADYLLVWGRKIKENYMKAGVNKEKIFVIGHPTIKSKQNTNLRFSFEKILIISKSLNGAQPSSNDYILSDRGNLILYLLMIQRVLLSFGIHHVTLRLHPSENYIWYKKHIDNSFFHFDQTNLQTTLSQSSLVIGPTSTVLLESISAGVNYIVFEPMIGNYDLINYSLVEPFDGTDTRVPIANTEKELIYLLKNKIQVEKSFLADYIKDQYDPTVIKTLIEHPV